MTEIQQNFSALGWQGREFAVVGAGWNVAFDIQGWMQGGRSKDLIFLLEMDQDQYSLHQLRTARL